MDKINPQYYRCTNNYDAEHSFILGKIYQVRYPDNFENINNFKGEDGKLNGWSKENHNHFEPVTELEWNLQEGIITKIVSEDYSYLIPILKQLDIK